MSWRVAKSLEKLRSQVDLLVPRRSKENDGTLGDAAHAARTSDHNPWVVDDGMGVVTAMDITHDPSSGLDSYELAELLRQRKDPRIKYIISNKRICSATVSPWIWRPYNGSNPHDHHVHISVNPVKALYDDQKPWDLTGFEVSKTKPAVGQVVEGVTATIFGTADDHENSAYTGHPITDTDLGVALPYRFPGTRPRVKVTNKANGKFVVCDVIDVGPWNVNDPYWTTPGRRPQAEYGTDMRGRKTNKAGIDLTPAAARCIGITGKGIVDIEVYTGVVTPAPAPAQPHGFWQQLIALLERLFRG